MLEEWDRIIRHAKPGAKAAADAMARYTVWRTQEITLRRTIHPPGAYHRQRSGEPPAYGSGTLARAMYMRPASEGIRSSALVGNRAPYSRILEFGCVVSAASKDFMSWADSAGRWYHVFLVHPPHPFIETTVDESIDDGELQEAAIKAFEEYDP
jgi:hypothetical protein